MSTITVGVDASETAAYAADTAAKIALALGAELQVISAFSATASASDLGTLDEEEPTTREKAEQLAAAVADRLRAAHPGLTVNADAEPGKPADALVNAADYAGATLIVIGNKRAQGPARLLGSIAVDVIRRASCDVYIAHTHGRD